MQTPGEQLRRKYARLRALAARMLRRVIRSPGFLARFILDDPGTRPDIDDDAADDDWTSIIHQRYQTPPRRANPPESGSTPTWRPS